MDRDMDTFAPFAPTMVTDHRPGVAGAAPVGLRGLLAGAVGKSPVDAAPGELASVEAIVVFDFGALDAATRNGAGGGAISPVNAALASVTDLVPAIPVLAQHESAQALAGRGRLVIDLEESAREADGLAADAHIDTARVVDALAALVDRAGWTSVGVVAHPAHVARCVATCQRLGLRVTAAPTGHLAELWDPKSSQWWTRRPALWTAREVAVVAHHMVTGRVLLRW
jgi:hypothetical protein